MITTLSNFTRSILNINSNRIRNKWSSPVCAIPRLIPRFHFPTARSRSSSPPSNVTMLIARRNFDRVEFPPFACLIDPSNASNRVSRENSLFKLVEIFTFPELFDFSHESCTTILTYVFYLVKVIVIIWNNE